MSAGQGDAAEWVMVPREPTPEMLAACATVIQGYGAKLVYARMLDAAPPAPVSEDAADAARYRWLREHADARFDCGGYVLSFDNWINYPRVIAEDGPADPQGIDEAIDAAMQEPKP